MAKRAMQASLREAVAEGLAHVRSKESAAGAAGTTLQTAIAEAIYDLDSSQIDPIANLEAGTSQYADGFSKVRAGRLQRIQALKTKLFGDDENEGVFDALRRLPYDGGEGS